MSLPRTAMSQVAHTHCTLGSYDSTEKGHAGLASYYTERGEVAGTWLGSGLGRS